VQVFRLRKRTILKIGDLGPRRLNTSSWYDLATCSSRFTDYLLLLRVQG
jgi:hypothetical protein